MKLQIDFKHLKAQLLSKYTHMAEADAALPDNDNTADNNEQPQSPSINDDDDPLPDAEDMDGSLNDGTFDEEQHNGSEVYLNEVDTDTEFESSVSSSAYDDVPLNSTPR